MPTAGKLYVYRESLSLPEIREKLEGWEEYVDIEDPDYNLRLRRNTSDIHLSTSSLEGLFSEDLLQRAIFRGVMQVMPYTVDSVFTFLVIGDEPYCVVLASKKIADGVANSLSVILHGEVGALTEPVLNVSALKELYESGEATKICLFDNIEIPNMDKGTLYGANIIQTDMYGRFINLGSPWYIVFKDKLTGYTVGIVRDGTCCIFSSVDQSGFLEYMKDNVVPLVLRRSHSSSK